MLELTPRVVQLLDSYADGQDARHCRLRIAEPQAGDLAAQPGQFFMLGVPGLGEAPFTYVSPPDAQGVFSALIRRTGRLTTQLSTLPPGVLLGYRGPFGQGWQGVGLLKLKSGVASAPVIRAVSSAQCC